MKIHVMTIGACIGPITWDWNHRKVSIVKQSRTVYRRWVLRVCVDTCTFLSLILPSALVAQLHR